MTDTDLLRASRDGDQFHYHWAARQALKLLLPHSDLTAIVIEGVSPDDTDGNAGEDVIDIAEYYGARSLRDAERVVYRQLKHSTVRTDQEHTVSDLAKTVSGFAKKFRQIRSEIPGAEEKVMFELVSNRPIRASVLQGIKTIASGQPAVTDHDVKFLMKYADFADESGGEAVFFRQLTIDTTAPSLLNLESIFRLDLSGMLPGARDVEHVLLKEMVARRASSLESDPVISRSTVLAALGVPPDDLLPVPSLVQRPKHLIMTTQARAIIDDFGNRAEQPVIVHAAGGVGKSVFTTQVEPNLPGGSITLVYDCFGNGGYRRSSTPRHQHRQGLIQLANELAAHALCDPLIPVAAAQPADYSKAFMARLQTSADNLAARHPEALLAVVVDAADNAALCAKDSDERTFVTDLLREVLPANVRLMMLCRTERIPLLNPPPHAHQIALEGFGPDESKIHLMSVFGSVTEQQAAEFHRRTGGNPRVQAFALETAADIDGCLASLGEALDAGGPVLDALLQSQVDQCKDAHHDARAEIDHICAALATLRPRIPVHVLSELCGVPPSLVHSFAADLGRPLLVDGDSLQFRDEPTETWFRNRCRPSGQDLVEFIARLTPLADTEPYAAVSLPQLLWEAGQVDALVELALTDRALPQGNDLEQREIAQQRAQFALKATLRARRDFEAARLALKSGHLVAGHSRRLKLLRSNTDLAGQFLDGQTIEDIVATRSLAGEWPGSNLHYEGALLSATQDQRGFARSRIRSASDWLRTWAQQSRENGDRSHSVDAADIAEVGLGLLNTDGVAACVGYVARWRPRNIAFEVGLIIATRLADAGRIEELEALGRTATRVKYLQFAVAHAAWHANVVCGEPLARRLVKMLKRQHRRVSFQYGPGVMGQNMEVAAVAWIVAMGLRHEVLSDDDAVRILCLCLPKDLGRGAGSRPTRDTETLLCGFALLAKARRQTLDVDTVAGADVLTARRDPHVRSRAVAEHQHSVVPAALWASLWIDALVGSSGDTDTRFQALAASTLKNYSDYEPPHLLIHIAARLGPRILAFGSSEGSRELLRAWYQVSERHIGVSTLIDAVRAAAAVEELGHIVITGADLVRACLDSMHEGAEYKAEQTVELARATYRFDAGEARAYFTQAMDLTDRVGDDVYAVWHVLMALTRAASERNDSDDRRASRVAQLIEGLDPYLGEASHLHPEALAAIGRLSPTTMTAVASRWRDRRFCSVQSFMEAFTQEDDSPRAASPLSILAMLPLVDRGVRTLELVERAFRSAPTDGANTARVIGEFVRPRWFRAESYDQLDGVARELAVDLNGTLLAPSARRIASPSLINPVSPRWDHDDEERTQRRGQLAADLSACDFATAGGWEAARVLVAGSAHMLHSDDMIDQAVRVPLPKIDDMVAAFQGNPHFTTFDYSLLIKGLASLSLLPQAARNQVHNLAQTAVTRFARDVATKSYDPIDLQALAALAGTPERELLGTALNELGSQPAALDSEQCYQLARRLAQRIPVSQAAVVLDDLLTLFADVAHADTGDGEVDASHSVPAHMSECVAGYLWSALGDPSAATRWRAAHCVRLLASLGRSDELSALFEFAVGRLDKSPFVDTRLPFYELHARQWLLFALARAAQDPATHQSLLVFTPLLKRVVLADAPHVVMRQVARDALTAMSSSGALSLTPAELQKCSSVNHPTGILRVSWGAHLRANRDQPGSEEEAEEPTRPEVDATPFRFFSDFARYWCAPLGEVFGLREEEVERLASRVVTDQWGSTCASAHREDARHTLKLYKDKGSYIHKSEWPEAEDLGFYLAIHALWTVAGDLVATRPVHQYEDEDADMFDSWLHRFRATRDDGRWLADRRDASPESVFGDGKDAPDCDWVWRLNSRHFRQRLFADDGWVTVWEYSDDATHGASQTVSVHSALVIPDKSRALVLALQTAPSFTSFCLPSAAEESHRIDHPGGFSLSGWILDQKTREGADASDPLAASIGYPPARPADEIVQLLDLRPDPDMRTWSRAGQPVLRSTAWNDTETTSRQQVWGQQGERLEIRQEALVDMLAMTGRRLIVDVTIGRTHEDLKPRYSGMRSDDDDETFPFLERSFKIYLFDASAGCSEL